VDVRIFDSPSDTALAVAGRIADAVRRQPSLVLGLPAGKTPLPVYDRLQTLHRDEHLDFSGIRVFMLDEFVGVSSKRDPSFRRFMQRHLFDGINVTALRIHALDGLAADLDTECRAYESAITRAGGIDLQVLGLGVNGHVAFNEPADALAADTHLTALRDDTRREHVADFGDLALVPSRALTMGIGSILRAASLIVIATGARKASAVAAMVQGPLTTHCPASFLQTHRDVTLYLDRDAAGRLTE
jgi:glucosamine-6-phosphate deaminase